MQTQRVEGIIIKRINFSEADRIITVFSKYKGKMAVKAAGVRKITSRRSPHVELLNRANLMLHIGRSMPIVTEATVIDNYSDIKDDLVKVGFAYHICELIDGLCPPYQENKTVFFLLQKTLERLSNSTDTILDIIHEFEIELLTLLGFWSRNRVTKHLNTHSFIEQILERKLKSKQILNRFR